MLRIKSKLQANLGVVSKIRYQITPHIVINLFHAMILSHLRYCNITWCYGNFSIRTSLQAQSNKFLRVGFHLHWRSCVKYLMDIFNLLSLNELAFKTLATTMHKIVSGSYPHQFSSMLILTQQRYLTSSSLGPRFTPTYHRYETTKQSLSHRACKVWISLPNEVRFRYPLSTQTDPRVSVDDRVQPYNPIQKFKILLHAYMKLQTIITPLF